MSWFTVSVVGLDFLSVNNEGVYNKMNSTVGPKQTSVHDLLYIYTGSNTSDLFSVQLSIHSKETDS